MQNPIRDSQEIKEEEKNSDLSQEESFDLPHNIKCTIKLNKIRDCSNK